MKKSVRKFWYLIRDRAVFEPSLHIERDCPFADSSWFIVWFIAIFVYFAHRVVISPLSLLLSSCRNIEFDLIWNYSMIHIIYIGKGEERLILKFVNRASFKFAWKNTSKSIFLKWHHRIKQILIIIPVKFWIFLLESIIINYINYTLQESFYSSLDDESFKEQRAVEGLEATRFQWGESLWRGHVSANEEL